MKSVIIFYDKVCSSLWVKIVNSDSHVFELYKEDGSNWFMVNLDTFNRDFRKLSDIIRIYYNDPRKADDGTEIESFTETIIPIVPHSWYILKKKHKKIHYISLILKITGITYV